MRGCKIFVGGRFGAPLRAAAVIAGLVGGLMASGTGAWGQALTLAPRNSFFGNVNAEFAINGNSHLPVRLGGGASVDLGYSFGNNRVFINSGVNYISGTPFGYNFYDGAASNPISFSYVYIPLTLNYGVVINAARVSFIPSVGFGYSFATTYAYLNDSSSVTTTINTSSFVVAPKLSVIYNLGDSIFLGGTGGGYVIASRFLKTSYAILSFTAGARF